MLSEKQQREIAGEVTRKGVMDSHCQNRDEVIQYLTVQITHAAMLIAKRSNADTAQCALYVPYQLLNQTVEQ